MNDLTNAVAALLSGHLVAFPTETVYGLGADATNENAVAKIYKAKGRPIGHPLIVHLASQNSLSDWAIEIPDYANRLAEKFWPGPMTLVLKRSALAKDFVTGSQDTVGIRVPSHPVAQALLTEFSQAGGRGVAAPSANIFGGVSPTTASAVVAELLGRLGPEDLILDGGASPVGIESTIIDCTQSAPAILRPGAVTKKDIEQATGLEILEGPSKIRVSGSLKTHYSPRAKVLLDAVPRAGDGLIAPANFPSPENVIRLAEPFNSEQYAQQLYAALREADRLGLSRVVAILPEGDDIALAVRDRLMRASAEK